MKSSTIKFAVFSLAFSLAAVSTAAQASRTGDVVGGVVAGAILGAAIANSAPVYASPPIAVGYTSYAPPPPPQCFYPGYGYAPCGSVVQQHIVVPQPQVVVAPRPVVNGYCPPRPVYYHGGRGHHRHRHHDDEYRGGYGHRGWSYGY